MYCVYYIRILDGDECVYGDEWKSEIPKLVILVVVIVLKFTE